MIFVTTFIALLVIVVAMSVGVIFANKPIKGSCGGMSAIGMDTVCDICGGDTSKCDEEQKRVASQEPARSLAYEVKP